MRTCANCVQRNPTRRRTYNVMQIHGELRAVDAWQWEAECLQPRDATWACSAQLRGEFARHIKKFWLWCADQLNVPGGYNRSHANRYSACSWMRYSWAFVWFAIRLRLSLTQ